MRRLSRLCLFLPALLLLALTSGVLASVDQPTVGFTFQPASIAHVSATLTPQDSLPDGSSPEAIVPPLDARNRAFQRGSWRWQVHGAAGTDFDDHFALGGVALSYFIDNDFTIDFELNGLYYLQDVGENTPGINLALLLRWHPWRDRADQPRWSIFVDAGFGIMLTSDNVPHDGETFNFTPQAGMGFTLLLDAQSDTRLITGVRVHHTSNANLLEDNPGSNKLMLYAGLNFPF